MHIPLKQGLRLCKATYLDNESMMTLNAYSTKTRIKTSNPLVVLCLCQL